MKLTRERKLYAAGLGLAALVFGADQLLNTKHADAATPAATPAAVVTSETPSAASNAVLNSPEPINQLAERLRNTAKAHDLAIDDLTDPFRAGGAAATSIDNFKSSHSLGAIMVSGRGGSAIINGKCVRIGQSIDGYKLESIREGVATLSGAAGQIELTLESKATAATDNAAAESPK